MRWGRHSCLPHLPQKVPASKPLAAYLAKRLVDLANEGGGTDNCTVVAAYCY
jgi:serine/threonine protein phosphatase PrpC